MTLNLAAAAAADPQYGWGKLVALIVAGAIFYAFTVGHARWKSTREDSSPAGEPAGATGAKPQAKVIGGTSGTTSEKGSKQLDVFVGQNVGKARTTDIVNQAQRKFRVSRRTALRAITRAKGGQS